MGGHGRFYAMQITKAEGVASVEVIDDEMRERYVKKEDIIFHLYDFYKNLVNNHDDMIKVLKLLYRYRELFLYIATFPKQNFLINRSKFVESIEKIKEMERRISLILLKVPTADLEIKDNTNQPIFENKINKEKMESFMSNKEVKLIAYEILRTFETNLHLKMEKSNEL